SIIWFFLGIGHLYRPPVAVACVLVGVALGVHAWRRSALTASRQAAPVPRTSVAPIVLVQALALVAALAPPTAKDTLLYHLALPKMYIAAGAAVDTPYNIASFYPLGVEMHSVWAMLLGGTLSTRASEAAAGATLFAFAPLLALVVYGWARERGADPAWASLAALSVAAIPTAYDVAAGGYVDLALTAYTALAVRGLGRWWTTLDAAWLPQVAFAVGAALPVKLTTVFLVLVFVLVILFRALQVSRIATPSDRPASGRLALSGLGALGIAFLFVIPLILWALATRRLEGELGLAVLVSSALFVFWLFSSQQLRYLLPATPAFAVALAVTGQGAAGALGAGLGRAFWWVV